MKEWLGGGRFGDVYLARDPLADRDVALKVVRYRGEPTPYLEEVQILARLDHPNVIRFYTVDIVEGRLVIVTEYVEGKTVRKLIEQKGRLPRPYTLDLARQLLDALQHAHERGIIHRDVKPENIIVSRGKLKVLDFGLSHIARDDLSLSMGGTPAYMAPENWRGEFTPRSDQWSAGVVILEMLTGVNPFSGNSLEEVREKSLKGVKEDRVGSLVPKELAYPILRALSIEPGNRYPGCRDFLLELLEESQDSMPCFIPMKEAREIPFTLSEEENRAVTHGGSRILVVGGPGTGKTTTIVARAVHLIKEKGMAPGSIVIATFSFRGWKELEARLNEVLGEQSRDIWLGNFHQLCLRIVSRFGQRLGLPREFTLSPPSIQEEIAKKAAKEIGQERLYEELLKKFRKARNEGIVWEELVECTKGRWREILTAFGDAYIKILQMKAMLTYDDLVYYANILLRDEDVFEFYTSRLKHLLVDEAQDMDKGQIELLERLGEGSHLFLAGDDDQSIYQWRGAHPEYLAQLRDKGFATFQLTRSFRLPPEFREAALNLIVRNEERIPKLFWTEKEEGKARFTIQPLQTPKEEGEYVADMVEILRLKEGYSYSDFAVLYRVNIRGRLLEQMLRRRGIPISHQFGSSLYQREEVQMLLSLLRYLARGKSERVLKELFQKTFSFLGMGWKPSSKRSLRDRLEASEDTNVKRLLSFLDSLDEKIRPSAALEGWLEILGPDIEIADTERIIARLTYMEEVVQRALDFEQWSKSPTISNFLRYIRFLSDSGVLEEEEGVKLLTAHGAKGLEFPVVLLVGMVEGEFPLSRSLGIKEEMEEERRLCYTAITRATQRLFISYYKYASPYSKFEEVPSRFIREILGV